MADRRKRSGSSKLAVAAGVVLIVVGLASLFSAVVPADLWARIAAIAGRVWAVAWPCALVAAGAYVLWAARTGRFSGFDSPRNGAAPFRRSRADKRIFGVCGGIAYYFGVDSTIVRVIAVVLLVAFPPMAVISYVVVALFVPQS